MLDGRTCAVCGASFTARTGSQKNCSKACSREHRLRSLRAYMAAKYQPRPARPPSSCEACGEAVPAPRSGRLRRWCESCRARKEDVRLRRRQRGTERPCYRCGRNVPERAGKPGKTVCEDCRQDPRTNRQDQERRRTLQRYGINHAEYARLLAGQSERCAICRTDKPGGRHWSIDHDHVTGHVRGLLCSNCNCAIGLLGDDPRVIRRAAEYVQTNRQLRLVV